MPEKIFIENYLPMSNWLKDIIPIRCGYVYRVGEFRLPFPYTTHSTPVIHCIYRGTCYFECRGESYELHPGDVFVFPKEEVLKYWSDDDLEYHWIVVGGAIEGLFKESDKLVFHTEHGEVFREMFEQSSKGTLTGFSAAAKVLEILDEAGICGGALSGPEYIRQAKLIVKAQSGPMTVKELAERVGLSYGYFSQLFKQSEGISAKTYIGRKSLDRAEVLLRSGVPITEVAESMGYADRFTFSKAYKKYKGKSPSEVRKSKGEKD